MKYNTSFILALLVCASLPIHAMDTQIESTENLSTMAQSLLESQPEPTTETSEPSSKCKCSYEKVGKGFVGGVITLSVIGAILAFTLPKEPCTSPADNHDMTDSCYKLTMSKCGSCADDQTSDRACPVDGTMNAAQLHDKISKQLAPICGLNATYCIVPDSCTVPCFDANTCTGAANVYSCNGDNLAGFQGSIQSKCTQKNQSFSTKFMQRGNNRKMPKRRS